MGPLTRYIDMIVKLPVVVTTCTAGTPRVMVSPNALHMDFNGEFPLDIFTIHVAHGIIYQYPTYFIPALACDIQVVMVLVI